MRTSINVAIAALTLCCGCATQQTQQIEAEYETPTMGWSSYNTFGIDINEDIIMRQADALVEKGLDEAGYRYINIDDGYFGGRDPQTGRLLIHPKRFPNGMQYVVDHIHSLGLKAGIYSDAGTNTCGNYWGKDSIADYVGLYGHDQQDCDMFFKEMGFDFIKVDYCGGTTWQNFYSYGLDEKERFTEISQAMKNTGIKGLRLNVCRWDYPGTWVSDVATSWRMSVDINCSWPSIRGIIDQSLYLSAYASRGHYNDMDMLEVGRTLSAEEDKTHFGMWCILSSPLLIGCDMRTLKPETIELITNPELIALNQDTLGLQAYVVKNYGNGAYAFVKDVETRYGLTRAVALYNSSDEEQNLSLRYSDVDLEGTVKARDLYERRDVDMPEEALAVTVPAHGTRIYKLTATQRNERSIYEAETAFLSKYQELKSPIAVGSAFYEKDEKCDGGAKVSNLGYAPGNDLRWIDVYSKEGGKYEVTMKIAPTENAIQIKEWDSNPGGYQFFMSVNGGIGNRIRYNADQTETTLTIELKPGNNIVRLYDDRYVMPGIDCMTLHKVD
ncbi:MAG: alpha-galactosidase [Bacteroidales bacterium]|nr:alpha-galactosidase [Bacteroidales bacterium]